MDANFISTKRNSQAKIAYNNRFIEILFYAIATSLKNFSFIKSFLCIYFNNYASNHLIHASQSLIPKSFSKDKRSLLAFLHTVSEGITSSTPDDKAAS